MTKSYFTDADAAIVVYDTTDASTFEEAKKWIDDVKKNTDENVVLALTGSKCDLEDNRAV